MDTAQPEEDVSEVEAWVVVADEECRSLNASWGDAYRSTIDQELRVLIERHDLLGDPTLKVQDGVCYRRSLPEISAPVPQLGRALFFSFDLSGDRDVACATCHHPLLGGADGLHISAGVGFDPSAVGADRVRGVTDVTRFASARNAPTVFNVALWDKSLFWDGRVEVATPERGPNGQGSVVTTPVGDFANSNLTAVQAHFPIANPEEMAGSLWGLHDSADGVWAAVEERLQREGAWVERFLAVCDAPPPNLPASWIAACSLDPMEAEDLVTMDHITFAIGEYERSMVLVESPWARYVKGDVDALSSGAKEGAAFFLKTVSEGGQNCVACHKGDFFTDEQFHVIAAPQIGPGLGVDGDIAGFDSGRGAVTSVSTEAYSFRTPTLLNVAHTPPYFHSGAVGSLSRVIQHYRGVQQSIDEYFGFTGEPHLFPPTFCRTAQFAAVPDCEALYSAAYTNGGDFSAGLDVELASIPDFNGSVTFQMEAFLRALSDTRLDDPTALAPWIEPESPLVVSTSSYEWDEWCDTTVERSTSDDLRIKGVRWAVLGSLPPGTDVNTGFPFFDVFGLEAWTIHGRNFSAVSGLSFANANVAAGVLAVMSVEQRTALLEGFVASREAVAKQLIADSREEVFDAMNVARSTSTAVDADRIVRALQDAAGHEAEVVNSRARVYGTVWAALPSSELEEHRQVMRRYLGGDLTALPAEAYQRGDADITVPSAIRDELDAAGVVLDELFAVYALSYGLWTSGPSCRFPYVLRQDLGGRRSAFYGFGPWVNNWVFELNTGLNNPLPVQKELVALAEDLAFSAGIDNFPAILDTTVARSRDFHAARERYTAALEAVSVAQASGASTATLEDAVEQAAREAAEAEANLLVSELDYYLRIFWDGADIEKERLMQYIACIESPEVQALRGAGGFDAIGGGSCLP